MTTTPADEIAAVETAFSVAEFDSNAYNWYYDEKDPDRKFISPEIVAGRTAFAAICERLRSLEAERDKAVSHINDLHNAHEELTEENARIEILEALIDECCSLRDVMNYPNGETILNEIRANVEARKTALLAASEEAKL